MNSSSSNHPLSDPAGHDLWSDVSQSLERFLEAWGLATQPPSVADFLPKKDSPGRDLALIELLKLDLEQRRHSDHPNKTLLEYAQEFPELLRDGEFPTDLLYEEFHHLKQSASVTPAEYAERYPKQRDHILRMVATNDRFETTSILPSRAPAALKPGDQVSDFELVRRLGSGSFATVFLALQRSMQRLVAVKISSDHGKEPETLAKLDHPNIVRVYDQRADEQRRLLVLYMQFLPAGTVQHALERLAKEAPQTWTGHKLVASIDESLKEQGVDIPVDSLQRKQLKDFAWWQVVCLLGSQLADALHYAHSQGVLHRDIKPANILLNESVVPKLADFNVSSCSKVDGASPKAYFGGSLAYMSPEQLEACDPKSERAPDDLDARSDVYSLGIVLWEMLTGSRPFKITGAISHRDSVKVFLAQRLEGIDQLASYGIPESVSSGLVDVLQQCLEPDRENRFATAGQLANRLRLCLNPQAESLLTRSDGMRRFVSMFPLIITVLTVMVPNALAGWFNFVYNYEAIIRPMNASRIFSNVQMFVNCVAFPLGLVIGMLLVWNPAKHIRSRLSTPPTTSAPTKIRRQTLRLGNRLSWLSIIEWSIAGIVYPSAMALAGAPLTGASAFHFFASLTLCGLIAATYPFFGTAAFVLDAWYPLLIRPENDVEVDRDDLDRVEKLSWRYLILAGTIPLASLLILTTWGRAENRLALIVLSAGGLALFAVAFALARSIQNNIKLFRSVAATKKSS